MGVSNRIRIGDLRRVLRSRFVSGLLYEKGRCCRCQYGSTDTRMGMAILAKTTAQRAVVFSFRRNQNFTFTGSRSAAESIWKNFSFVNVNVEAIKFAGNESTIVFNAITVEL